MFAFGQTWALCPVTRRKWMHKPHSYFTPSYHAQMLAYLRNVRQLEGVDAALWYHAQILLSTEK